MPDLGDWDENDNTDEGSGKGSYHLQEGDDEVTAQAVDDTHADGGQIHIYGDEGDDILNLDFAIITNASDGHHARGGTRSGGASEGADIFNFMNLSNISGVVVGRIEDFEVSLDEIHIDDVKIDLTNPPSNVRILAYNGDHSDSSLPPQQWLLIDTGNGGRLLYALEGARADGDVQEPHFIDTSKLDLTDMDDIKIIGTGGNPDISVPEIDYVDPQNYVPDGFESFLGSNGFLINDTDFADVAADGDDVSNGINVDVVEVIEGSTDDDLIAGGLNGDRIEAKDGDDHIWGGDGDDTIYGDGGNDIIKGGSGEDSIFGGTGADTINGGLGDDDLNGWGGTDTIYGDEGNDDISGGGGNDTLYGGDGNDDIDGGNGDDTMFGGDKGDDLAGGDGDDELNGGGGNDLLEGENDNDVINGDIGNDTLRGGSGNDTLNGGDGDDIVQGGSGDDIIRGGTGEDIMRGGGGDDVFEFLDGDMIDWDSLSAIPTATAKRQELDVITDFVIGSDSIDLSGFASVQDASDLSANDVDFGGNNYIEIKVIATNERFLVEMDDNSNPNDFLTTIGNFDFM